MPCWLPATSPRATAWAGWFPPQMMAVLDMPIYFVLGNHDFYRGSVVGTRSALTKMISGSENLVYLSQVGVVELMPRTALVGHDGWADARLGDFDGTEVILNDFLLIDELRCWTGPLHPG